MANVEAKVGEEEDAEVGEELTAQASEKGTGCGESESHGDWL